MVIFGYIGHLFIGSMVATFVARDYVSFMTIIIASLLPDIDHKNSMIGRFNPVARFMHHRGHAHSFVGIAILSAPFVLFGIQYMLFAFIGALAHLLGDKLLSWFPSHSKFKLKVW